MIAIETVECEILKAIDRIYDRKIDTVISLASSMEEVEKEVSEIIEGRESVIEVVEEYFMKKGE